ncbi:hypothetical protein L904_15035 [Agrobacterium sp. LY4]|nr:hypothetical protein L904_15035 [Agrobacterium sp. LY4]
MEADVVRLAVFSPKTPLSGCCALSPGAGGE